MRFLLANYPIDPVAAVELLDLIKRQIEENFPVPDDLLLMVEGDGAESILNACLGHKTNDTIGRVLAAILSAKFGSSVALEIDPYRIELTLPKNFLAEEIARMLTELDPDHIQPILEMTLKNTTLLRWKMVHVARKFGALSKHVDYQKISMIKLLGVFEGTPLHKEALREIYQDRLDLKNAREFLKGLRRRRRLERRRNAFFSLITLRRSVFSHFFFWVSES